MPRMMREIVLTTIRSQPDMQVVATVEVDDVLTDAVERGDADVVVVGLDDGEALRPYEALLYRYPRLHLLAVLDDGRGALLCELRPHRTPVHDVSPTGLVEAIRASVRETAR